MLTSMLTIAIVSFFALLTLATVVSLVHSVTGGIAAGKATLAELALIRSGRVTGPGCGVTMRSGHLPANRGRGYARPAVRLRPLRPSSVAA